MLQFPAGLASSQGVAKPTKGASVADGLTISDTRPRRLWS